MYMIVIVWGVCYLCFCVSLVWEELWKAYDYALRGLSGVPRLTMELTGRVNSNEEKIELLSSTTTDESL
jgi:hypothetical protein